MLGGTRKYKRYQIIKVQWKTAKFQIRIKPLLDGLPR